jgi:acetylornithine deacetylase
MVPLDPGARRAILDACDSLRDETLEWLFRLVRCPSTLGNEASALNEMERLYRHLGLEPFRVPIEPAQLAAHPGFSPPLLGYDGRDNLAAIHRPKSARGRSLALQGHVDVVPEGAAELWTTPPFQPEVREGRVFGRGAGDMKAGVVSAAMAFLALRRAGLAPAAEVQMAAVIEEECTGNGALAAMLALPKPDAVIIPEPGEALCSGEVGVVWAWVTVTGRPAHVARKQSGVSAIEAAAVIAEAFRRYEEERNRAEHIHPIFRGHNHPLNVNLGTIEGGEWNSSVATRCRIGLRVGVMIGYAAQQVRADIERLVAEAARDERLSGTQVKLEFKGFVADACLFPMDSDIAALSRRSFTEATGRALGETPFTGLTDGRFYALYQGTPCAVFGPEAQDIHGIDENVGVESIHGITRTLALALAEWCGVEAA